MSFEFGAGERATIRLVHENEIVRYDEPDELDFDSGWARTGFQVEIHRSLNVDFSIMPQYAFLTSSTAPGASSAWPSAPIWLANASVTGAPPMMALVTVWKKLTSPQDRFSKR